MAGDTRLVLLFDGTCGPCTRLAEWVRRRDAAGRLLVRPNQSPGALAAYGLTRAEVDRSAWAIEPDGRRLEGAAALNRVLEELGGGWRLLSRTYRLAPLAALEEGAYRRIAANRERLAWLGVTPECDSSRRGPQGVITSSRASGRMKGMPATPPAPSTLDARAYEFLNGLPHTGYSDRYIGLVSDLGEGAGWAFAGLWLAALDGHRGRRAAIASTAAAALSTYIAQRLLKPIFRRNRPWFTREAAKVVGGKTPDHSFPSGHTAASFAAATVVAMAYPSARPLLFATASAVGLSRIHLGHHFPSDVIAGGLLGTGIGLLSGLAIGVRGQPGRRRRRSLLSPR